jgi:hypothetical protein
MSVAETRECHTFYDMVRQSGQENSDTMLTLGDPNSRLSQSPPLPRTTLSRQVVAPQWHMSVEIGIVVYQEHLSECDKLYGSSWLSRLQSRRKATGQLRVCRNISKS